MMRNYDPLLVEHTWCCDESIGLCGDPVPNSDKERFRRDVGEDCFKCLRLDGAGKSCGGRRCPYRPLWQRILWPSRRERQ